MTQQIQAERRLTAKLHPDSPRCALELDSTAYRAALAKEAADATDATEAGSGASPSPAPQT